MMNTDDDDDDDYVVSKYECVPIHVDVILPLLLECSWWREEEGGGGKDDENESVRWVNLVSKLITQGTIIQKVSIT
eukprot:4873041-Ditylum_brightwellii.AAC.1